MKTFGVVFTEPPNANRRAIFRTANQPWTVRQTGHMQTHAVEFLVLTVAGWMNRAWRC